jgi:hypothetical protein
MELPGSVKYLLGEKRAARIQSMGKMHLFDLWGLCIFIALSQYRQSAGRNLPGSAPRTLQNDITVNNLYRAVDIQCIIGMMRKI